MLNYTINLKIDVDPYVNLEVSGYRDRCSSDCNLKGRAQHF